MAGIDDLLEHPELLGPTSSRPPTFIEAKYVRLFAVDLHGQFQHDQYVFVAINGLVVVGLAPSHPLIRQHRQRPDYQPPITPAPLQQQQQLLHTLAAPVLTLQEQQEQQHLSDGRDEADVEEPVDEEDKEDEAAASAGCTAATGFDIEALRRVDFDCGKKGRAEVKQSGKRRLKGNLLKAGSLICRVEAKDGSRCGLHAKQACGCVSPAADYSLQCRRRHDCSRKPPNTEPLCPVPWSPHNPDHRSKPLTPNHMPCTLVPGPHTTLKTAQSHRMQHPFGPHFERLCFGSCNLVEPGCLDYPVIVPDYPVTPL